jgi:hypothetical protein
MEPRKLIQRIEETALLPAGNSERFEGYAVIGLPFRSGHVLALRRFPASSVGPSYTSVWHRDPQSAWTFYSTVNPELGCSRYWGREITRNIVAPIGIDWTGPTQFSVTIGTTLRWEVRLTQSLPSRLMNAAAKVVPVAWWQRKFMPKAMGAAARIVLATGRMNLAGKTANDYEFIANPQRVWLIESSQAIVNGLDLGPVGALAQQARLGEFLIRPRVGFHDSWCESTGAPLWARPAAPAYRVAPSRPRTGESLSGASR